MRSVNETIAPRHFKWSFPPQDLALSDDHVHVWVADLDQQEIHLKDFAKTLSSDEQKRASRFQFRQDRNHFVAARGLLRTILSRYINLPADNLEFSYGHNGKPSLVESLERSSLNFNLSHSGGLALYAVSQNRELGIDLEKVSEFSDMDDIAARCFLEEEQKALQFLAPEQKAQNFFRHWTRKEAQLKCTGEGFSSAPENEIHFGGTLLELEPAEQYIAALAVRGKPFQLKTWQWQNDHLSRKLALP